MLPSLHLIAEPDFFALPAHQPERAPPRLRRHSLLHPPLARANGLAMPKRLNELNAGVGTIWKLDNGTLDGTDTLLTMRYFAVQALQFRIEQMVRGSGVQHSPGLELFLSRRLDHAYVDACSYPRLAANAADTQGEPVALPVFLDMRRECLVVDTSRFFIAESAGTTAAAVHGIVAMTQSPRFMACLEQQPALTGSVMANAPMTPAAQALQDAARCVARYVLNEPGMALTSLAGQLARGVGAKVVVRALLTGAVNEMRAAVSAFKALCKEAGVSASPTAAPSFVKSMRNEERIGEDFAESL